MTKVIFKYGLFGGLIVAVIMFGSLLFDFHESLFEIGMVIGYASMILAFSLIFVALKHIRDTQYEGSISFGKAFKAAILITLVTSTIYVAAWLICYHFFIPDFMEAYTSHILNKAKAEGASAAELSRQTNEMQQYSTMYKNPLFMILITYTEILPVGLIVSVIAALVIKRKKNGLPVKESYTTTTA